MPVRFTNEATVINPPPSPRNSPRSSVTLRTPRTRQSGKDSRSSKTHTSGRKRKTKVKNAKKSKRGSQKKRGRRTSRRGGGGYDYKPKVMKLEEILERLNTYFEDSLNAMKKDKTVSKALDVFENFVERDIEIGKQINEHYDERRKALEKPKKKIQPLIDALHKNKLTLLKNNLWKNIYSIRKCNRHLRAILKVLLNPHFYPDELYYPNGTQRDDTLNDSCDFFLTFLLKSIIQTFYYNVRHELSQYKTTEYGDKQVVAMLDRIDGKTARTYNTNMDDDYRTADIYFKSLIGKNNPENITEKIMAQVTELKNL